MKELKTKYRWVSVRGYSDQNQVFCPLICYFFPEMLEILKNELYY